MKMLAIVGLLFILASCTPAKGAADADYLAEQLACVDRATTKDEATACRNAIKAAWAADGGAR